MKRHAPRDVTEGRDGTYRCGICGREVTRYSVPRVRWVHSDESTLPTVEPSDKPIDLTAYNRMKSDGLIMPSRFSRVHYGKD